MNQNFQKKEMVKEHVKYKHEILTFVSKWFNQNILTIKLFHLLTRLKRLSEIKILSFNLTYFYWKINLELLNENTNFILKKLNFCVQLFLISMPNLIIVHEIFHSFLELKLLIFYIFNYFPLFTIFQKNKDQNRIKISYHSLSLFL